MNALRVCLVGLPEAGKSSFIVALWAYLGAGPTGNSYRITAYPKQIAYLKNLADAWFTGKPLDRNTLGTIRNIEFTLTAPDRRMINVFVPDLPGEAFKQAVTSRRIEEDIAALVAESDLLLFFINAKDACAFHALADLPPPLDNEPEPIPPFDVAELDSDLLNSELLQQLQYLLRDSTLPGIVVMISAWDLCLASRRTPTAWLEDVQPMFFQTLAEVGRNTGTLIVGVSAQGDDYEVNPAVIKTPPLERAYLVNELGVRSNDITMPFSWFEGLRDQG